jgi:hypothetical protein
VGIDVFARLREFNKARNIGALSIPNVVDDLPRTHPSA